MSHAYGVGCTKIFFSLVANDKYSTNYQPMARLIIYLRHFLKSRSSMVSVVGQFLIWECQVHKHSTCVQPVRGQSDPMHFRTSLYIRDIEAISCHRDCFLKAKLNKIMHQYSITIHK